jgi:RNA polymerase sigma-70 factor (ECF subfamily)
LRSSPPPSASVESLLAHRAWVRRLLRALVAEPQDAADVEQETWRRALERPPLHAANLRAWLSSVARNVARRIGRDEATRARHEGAVAGGFAPGIVPPLAPAAAEVVERAQLQRRVVDTVLALDEPYRSTILLRYLDDLAPSAIATRTGVPVDTVKTRLKRGLALVRARLNSELGTDEHGLVGALAPLLVSRLAPPAGVGSGATGAARGAETASAAAVSGTGAAGAAVASGTGAPGAAAAASVSSILIGGTLVSKSIKLAAVAAAMAAAMWWPVKSWLSRPAPTASEEGVVRKADTSPAASHPPAAEESPPASDIATVREETAERKATPPSVTPQLAAIEGRVVDASGAPVSGALVVLDRMSSSGNLASLAAFRGALRRYVLGEAKDASWRTLKSTSDGGFRFDEVDPNHHWAVGAMHDPLGTGWSEVSFQAGAQDPDRVLVVLHPGVVVSGVVRDPLGRPVSAASVMVMGSSAAPQDPTPGFSWEEFNDFTVTGEDGSYRSMPLPWRHVKMHVLADDRPDLAQLDTAWEELPAGAVEARRDLIVPALERLRGRILGPDGQPARLRDTLLPRLGADARRTQSGVTISVVALAEDPRIRTEVLDLLGGNEPGVVYLDADKVYGTISFEDDRYEIPLRHAALRYVAIVARKALLGVAEIQDSAAGPDVVIDPGLLPERSLLHTLLLRFRDAREGKDGAPLARVMVHAVVQSTMRDGRSLTSIVNFGPPGELTPVRLLDLPTAPCAITMSCEGFVTRSLSVDPSRPGAPTELTIDFVAATSPLAVTVVDPDGKPIQGAWIRVYHGADLDPVVPEADRATDEHGACTLAGLPRGPLTLVAQKDGFTPAVARVPEDDETRTATLELEPGYEVTIRAQPKDGPPAPWGLLVVLDEQGVPLYDALHPRLGAASRLTGRRLRLVDGTYEVRCLVALTFEGATSFVAAPGITVDVELQPIAR